MKEPRTAAGRAFLDNPGGTREVRAWAICAIENEAAAIRADSPCRITREIGGHWCHEHEDWADAHELVVK
jgi:hypothetical protein